MYRLKAGQASGRKLYRYTNFARVFVDVNK
jgi:hypothetical protein